MQSQPRSSAGSPLWASSQSITAARPCWSTIRLPSRKSPWTTRGSTGPGRCSRSQRSPSSTTGSGSPIRSSSASQCSIWAITGSPPGMAGPKSSRSIEWIRAAASPSWTRGRPVPPPAPRCAAPAAPPTPRRRRRAASRRCRSDLHPARAPAAREPGRPPSGRARSAGTRPACETSDSAPGGSRRSTKRCGAGLDQPGLARGAAGDLAELGPLHPGGLPARRAPPGRRAPAPGQASPASAPFPPDPAGSRRSP